MNQVITALLTLASALGITLVVSPVVIPVAVSADLHAAMVTAPSGATIALEPGATYLGHFRCVQPVTLTTRDVRIPQGMRVTLADAPRLATLRSPDNQPAFATSPGVSGCAVDAVAFSAADPRGTVVAIGTGVETDAIQLPTDVTLRHVLILGDSVAGLKRGLGFHGVRLLLEDSYVGDVKSSGQQTQAVWTNLGDTITLRNNYLEASGENYLVGGEDPRIVGHVPSGILVEGNHLAKPLAWRALTWDVCNLLELKNARIVTVRSNRLSGTWPSCQAGYAVLLTPKQRGAAPWATVEDVLFEGNVVRDTSSGINITGDAWEAGPSQRAKRLVIRHNLIIADRMAYGGDGRCLMIGRGPQQVVYSHNTCISNGSSAVYTYSGGVLSAVSGAEFVANLWVRNTYGFSGVGTSEGIPTLANYYPGAVWSRNVMAGGIASRYPVGTLTPSVTAFQLEFVDYAGGDYRVQLGGVLDGLGADIARLPK